MKENDYATSGCRSDPSSVKMVRVNKKGNISVVGMLSYIKNTSALRNPAYTYCLPPLQQPTLPDGVVAVIAEVQIDVLVEDQTNPRGGEPTKMGNMN